MTESTPPAPTPPLVLASASPRRAEILVMLGLSFSRVAADIPELPEAGEAPEIYVERLAREKARVVAARHPDALVVAGDTIVVLKGEIIEKPGNEEEAVRMLLRLAARTHTVFSGVAVAAPGGRMESGVARTDVTFRPFAEETARAYVATGEPMDKAGAYGIQGFGASLVRAISGDHFTVVGLPIVRMMEVMERTGWSYRFGRIERHVSAAGS